MAKKLSVLFSVILLLAVSVSLFGCGQGIKSEVSIVPGAAKGLTIQGTVKTGAYAYTMSSYSYVSYSFLQKDAIAGAKVSIPGLASSAVVTDANGFYSIKNVSPGSYTVIVTREGFQDGVAKGAFPENPSENTVLTLDVLLVDNPKIVSATIDANSALNSAVIVFSEPMDITTVIPTLYYAGMSSYGVSSKGVVEAEKSWDTANKILTIKPKNNFLSGSLYGIFLSGPAGDYLSIKDMSGNSLDYSGYSTSGNSLMVNLITTVATAPAPSAAPANFQFKTANGTTEIDYSDIYYYNNYVTLSWNPVDQATSYKLYCRYNNGPFQLYSDSSYSLGAYKEMNIKIDNLDSSLADFTRTGYSYPEDKGYGIVWPFVGSNAIDFKVVAANSNGESPASNIITIKDTKKPQVHSASYIPYNYAPTYSSKEAYVFFTEPLDKNSAETIGNYSISGQTISKAQLTNIYSGSSYRFAQVALTMFPGTTTIATVEVSSNVKDLSGNGIELKYNSGLFYGYPY